MRQCAPIKRPAVSHLALLPPRKPAGPTPNAQFHIALVLVSFWSVSAPKHFKELPGARCSISAGLERRAINCVAAVARSRSAAPMQVPQAAVWSQPARCSGVAISRGVVSRMALAAPRWALAVALERWGGAAHQVPPTARHSRAQPGRAARRRLVTRAMVNVDFSPSVMLGVGLIGAGVSLWQVRRCEQPPPPHQTWGGVARCGASLRLRWPPSHHACPTPWVDCAAVGSWRGLR